MSKKVIAALLLTLGMALASCGDANTQEVAEETVAVENIDDTAAVTEEVTPEVTQEPEEKEEVTATPEVTETPEITEEADGLNINWDDITKYEEAKVMYIQKNVNIRKGPGTDYDKVGSFKLNDEVQVIGKCNSLTWYEIQYGEEVAFVHSGFVGEEQVDLEALKAEQEAAAMALIEQQKAQEAEAAKQAEAQGQPAPTPAAPVVVQAPAGLLFIGDSRCVQMKEAVGGVGTWICEGGKRYEWFSETAVPKADPIVGKGTKVIICMGVNDPWAYEKYAALANVKAAEWAARGAKVYYVSVNPVWENPYVTQEQVENFNANIPGMLSGVRYIDTASVLKANGYRLVDGLHYDTDTYVQIFNLIVASAR